MTWHFSHHFYSHHLTKPWEFSWKFPSLWPGQCSLTCQKTWVQVWRLHSNPVVPPLLCSSLMFICSIFGCIEMCSDVSWMIWLMSLTLKRLKCTPVVLLTVPLYQSARHCEHRMPKCQYCMNSVYLKSCHSIYSLLIWRFLSCADGQSYANARHFPVLRKHRTLLRCDWW